MRIFITGTGVICPLGSRTGQLAEFIRNNHSRIHPLTLFRENVTLPVGEIRAEFVNSAFPRTHSLALKAAWEALEMAGSPVADAVIFGSTTGGMFTTEKHFEAEEYDPTCFPYHGTGTVADLLAKETGCTGPVMTVSTACSSGSAAIILALALLRTGRAAHVLTGGADSLCYLTYHGFHSLQLIDPGGARPFDRDRRGMSVGEGAAVLVLSASETVPPNAVAEVRGGGLSCDAYHPTAPHPEGKGAALAIRAALKDAGISAADIDYISLHGTGTVDNDRSEARALEAIFRELRPPASSIKGAMGHPLAAAGAIEAVAASLAVDKGLLPANTGCRETEPEIQLNLLKAPAEQKIQNVLSNSFGFGGNNAVVVIGSPGVSVGEKKHVSPPASLRVEAAACLTGAGDMAQTVRHLSEGRSCEGMLPLKTISRNLPPREIRRLKRLPRLALSLSEDLRRRMGDAENPNAVFWGTGWGPLSETHDFLKRLFDSDHQFTSPTDFIGSVHNAPAGHLAAHLKANGPNLTLTGGDYSFEQALFSASLLGHTVRGPFLVLGADEHHSLLSDLFDPSVHQSGEPSDGGGALRVRAVDADACSRSTESKNTEPEPGNGVTISLRFYGKTGPSGIPELIESLGGTGKICDRFGGIFAGIPAAGRPEGESALKEFLSLSEFNGPVFDYRKQIGEFASASAVAASLAVYCCRSGKTFTTGSPAPLAPLKGKGILLLGFGPYLTAIEVQP